jgi:hypothetical protein
MPTTPGARLSARPRPDAEVRAGHPDPRVPSNAQVRAEIKSISRHRHSGDCTDHGCERPSSFTQTPARPSSSRSPKRLPKQRQGTEFSHVAARRVADFYPRNRCPSDVSERPLVRRLLLGGIGHSRRLLATGTTGRTRSSASGWEDVVADSLRGQRQSARGLVIEQLACDVVHL